MQNQPRYLELADHIGACFDKFGDSYRGVDWWTEQDAHARYKVMLDLAEQRAGERPTLLDLGCGCGHLLDYIRSQDIAWIRYRGADVLPKFVEHCRAKFPGIAFDCVDILRDPTYDPNVDFVAMNGVFTLKLSMTQDDMFAFFESMLVRAFAIARRGIAFNVMSDHVDRRRDIHFHVPFDRLATFITRRLGRRFVIRHDFLPYEYAVYVLK